MARTIDMHDIMYINIFGRVTHINTKDCFMYNDILIFCVPASLVSRAIGERGNNVKRINEILGKKIKIISCPEGIEDARKFITDIVAPVQFKDFEISNNEIVINAGSQSKAALIGRNKRRLLELQKISKDYFDKDLRII